MQLQYTCANTNAIFKEGGCQCRDGYMIMNILHVVQKYLTDDPTESCIPAYQVHSIETGGTTATIDVLTANVLRLVTSNDQSLNRISSGFKISEKTRTGYRKLESLDSIVSVSTVGDKTRIHLINLEPGTEYLVDMVHFSNYQDFKFVTQCSCTENGSDVTGRPIDLLVQQQDGYVLFEFTDNSRCDGAYAFTRESALEEFSRSLGTATSFAPNFFITSGDTCDQSQISPGLTSADDLKVSRLGVGATFAYCVRATNTLQYMDSPYDATEGSIALTSSDDTCASHTIHWEASVSGLITTEPDAGSLPIKEVQISYQLISDEYEDLICDGCAGETTTNAGGSFEIELNVIHPYLKDRNNDIIPVKLFFSKTTPRTNDPISHKFLCNEGQDVCDPDNGYLFYVEHLHFNAPLHVYDDTSVTFNGKVIIDGTRFDGNTGCPLQKAKVCVQHRTTLNELMRDLICVQTDSNGFYAAPIIIGSTIHNVHIDYHGHVFERASENQIDYGQGLEISAGGFYANNDFRDMSKAKVTVQGKSQFIHHQKV
jgi:hypothetical protein